MANVALMALCDQIQQMCIDSVIDVVAFVVFLHDGEVEYRSPYPREVVKPKLIAAAEAL